jgi:hypothetical protein
MALLATQQVVETGLAPVYSAATAGGDTFTNDGSDRQFIHAKNANVGATRTVTVAAVVSTTAKPGFPTLDVDDLVVVVPISGERMIGPIPQTAFGAIPDITYDDEADVTLGIFKI